MRGGIDAETDIGGPGGAFPATLWSVVVRAKDVRSPDRRQALGTLIRAYWKPLYFFIRRKGNTVESSKDLTQGFFTQLIEKDFLKYVDRDRGKFRTFLLTAFEHHVADEFDRARAQKRGGDHPPLSLDFEAAEGEIAGRLSEPPDRAFRRDWAIRVMSQALDRLRAGFEQSGRPAEFEAIKGHLTATRPDGATYEDIARTLGISVEDVRNRIKAARARYREAILDVIRSYTDSEAEAKDELTELFSAFS